MCQGLGYKRVSLRNAMQRWGVVTDRRKIKRLRRKGIEGLTLRS